MWHVVRVWDQTWLNMVEREWNCNILMDPCLAWEFKVSFGLWLAAIKMHCILNKINYVMKFVMKFSITALAMIPTHIQLLAYIPDSVVVTLALIHNASRTPLNSWDWWPRRYFLKIRFWIFCYTSSHTTRPSYHYWQSGSPRQFNPFRTQLVRHLSNPLSRPLSLPKLREVGGYILSANHKQSQKRIFHTIWHYTTTIAWEHT